jgi:hypothetical protein
MASDSTGAMAALGAWRDRLTARLQQGSRRPLFRAVRVLTTLAIAGVLAVQLTHVGWAAILDALPTHPLFYGLLLLVYAALPVTEVWIYGPLWSLGRWPTLLACARKRVLNEEVLGYSGEVSLYLWAAGNGLETGRAFRAVRDVNIVSSAVSFTVAGMIVGLMAAFGAWDLGGWVGERAVSVVLGLVLLVGIGLLAVRFRRHLFTFSRREALRVGALHFARHVVTNALLVAMWHLAQPEVSLGVWLTFAAVLVVVERLPFLPSRDLVFLGASVELSKTMPVAAAAVAGMFLVQSGVFKLLHLAVFVAAPLGLRRSTRRAEGLTIPREAKTPTLFPARASETEGGLRDLLP